MKVAIYCRLSEEDRNKQFETNDSESIKNQKSMLIQYVMEQGWEVYNIYSDDDYTGVDRKRPEFNRLLNDAEQHKFDIVLCKTQSRFTRELELVEKYIHGLFPIWNIRFISIVDNADTENKGNKKSRQINGLVNEWYLEDMSENIRSVLVNKRQNGLHIGAFALYGYKKDPKQKGHLIIDEEAAAIVREVFILFSQGYGKTAIARILNDRGIPNPTEYKRLQGLRYQQPKMKSSTLWKYFAISNMLTNEMYIGNMVQGKYGSISYKTKQNKPRPKEQWYRVEGTHKAIISQELWDKVQILIAQNIKPFDTGKIGLFARKARCANCGYVLRSSKSHNKHYLQCANRYIAKDACVGSFISLDKLEKAVIAEINQLTEKYLDKNELKQKIEFSNNLNEWKAKFETDIMVDKRKIEEYKKYSRELYLDKVKGIITENDYIELSKEFTAKRENLEQEIIKKEKQFNELEKKLKIEDNHDQLINQYTKLDYLNREVVEKLIDYILVGKRILNKQELPIEIHWNF